MMYRALVLVIGIAFSISAFALLSATMTLESLILNADLSRGFVAVASLIITIGGLVAALLTGSIGATFIGAAFISEAMPARVAPADKGDDRCEDEPSAATKPNATCGED